MILKITTNLILTTDKNTAKNSTPSPDRDVPSEAFPLGIRLRLFLSDRRAGKGSVRF